MTEHRHHPGKEWGSKARKAEDTPGRKSQERQAAIDDALRSSTNDKRGISYADSGFAGTDVHYPDPARMRAIDREWNSSEPERD